MYLVDTNVWLERLLDQERATEVKRFLDKTPSEDLFITDFAFHSLCTILIRFNKSEPLLNFVKDAFIDGAVNIVRIHPNDTQRLVNVIEEFNLDFDDAYQYLAAKLNHLKLVSFDRDFDDTQIGRTDPHDLI